MIRLEDEILKLILADIEQKYAPHTIILYGSYARGDATRVSDYDIVAIRQSGEFVRDCRLLHDHYLDAFIYSESDVQMDALLRIKDGIVLKEKDSYGNKLLTKIKKMYQEGPSRTPDWEKKEIPVWLEKMLNRAKIDDIEGNFRRHWLLHDLLECYFKMRDEWYLGPKESFQWLKKMTD